MAEGPRRVLVAGGTRGIGLAVARRLAVPGGTMFLSYGHDEDAARQAAVSLRDCGAGVHLVRQDVGTVEGAAATMEQVASVSDRLDVLVHSAAIASPGALTTQNVDEILRAVQVGGLGLLYLVRAGLALLRRGSSVIFLSGGAVDLALPGHGALAAAKALGECLVRYLAIEMAPGGIRVNTLRTGPVDTALLRAYRPGGPGEGGGAPVTPLGRLGTDHIAEVAAFLASPAAAMIQGQTLVVDGGLGVTVRKG